MRYILLLILFVLACSSPTPERFSVILPPTPAKYIYKEKIFAGKTVIIGTGSGTITKKDMTGLVAGDILKFKPGAYTNFDIGNLTGIKISGFDSATFSSTSTFTTLTDCYAEHFKMLNVTGNGINWNGKFRNIVERFITFNNVTGNCNDFTGSQITYAGDSSTLKGYNIQIDNNTFFKAGAIALGSWGEAKDKSNYIDSFLVTNNTIDSTLSNGTEVRGVFFRYNVQSNVFRYKGTITVLGDVGLYYIYGNGVVANNYRNGGRGYMVRLWNVTLGNYVANSYFYNNIDINSSTYGSIESRIEAAQVSTYTPNGGNCYVINNTSINKQDNIGYWSPLLQAGTFPKPYILQCWNNAGANLYTGKPTNIWVDQSNGTWPIDTLKNYYQRWAAGMVDSVYGGPVANSPLIGKGVSIPFITKDIYGNPRTSNDIGAVASVGVPNPCQPVIIHDTIKIHDTLKIHDTIPMKIIKTAVTFKDGSVQTLP